MNARSIAAYLCCYLAPASLASYAVVRQDQVNLTGYVYMLIFLAAPLVLLAVNAIIAGREPYRRALMWVAIGHTLFWMASQALNVFIQVGELYNLLVIPAICVLGLLMLPVSLYVRFKRQALTTI